MANNFTVISTKFFDQFINGVGLDSNTSSFNTVLTGNSGDLVKLVQEIEVSTIFNEDLDKTVKLSEMVWDPAIQKITGTVDFVAGGFYPGAIVRVEQGASAANITITAISGIGNKDIIMSDASGDLLNAFLTYGTEYTDVTIKLLTNPIYLNYSYGLNAEDFTGEDYTSPLDTNQQSYYTNSIATDPSASTLSFAGGQIGSSLGSVSASFVATYDNYRHRYIIYHTFRIPYYVEGELTNITDGIPPENLESINTLRYDNKYVMGSPSHHNTTFINPGAFGNVGYFNENFNGLVNDYTITDLDISNISGSGVIEITESNTISFNIESSTDDFQSGITGIAGHSRLPVESQYQYKTEAFDSIWMIDSALGVESGPTVSSSIITDLEFSIAAPKVIGVEFTVSFSPEQIEESSAGENYSIWFSIANKNLTDPELIDRVNLIVSVGEYTLNTDVSDLITSHDMQFFPSWSAFDGGVSFTDFTGGDGDLWGVECSLVLNSLRGAKIQRAKFKVIADNGTDTFELWKRFFPVYLLDIYDDGTYEYQISNADVRGELNLPDNDPLNRVVVAINTPVAVGIPTQPAKFNFGFQTPWRDWLLNDEVPLVFYDTEEPQNNRNFKTSNYSGEEGYVIYGVMELEMLNNLKPETTTYEIYSSACSILDFDDSGWTGYTGDTKLFSLIGEEVDYIEDNENRIVKVECNHSLGIIPLGEIAAFVWTEIDGATAAPEFLSSTRDWTSDTNYLQPTDTLELGNYTLVEVISETDKVTLVCQTNSENITPGVIYKIYGRFWVKS